MYKYGSCLHQHSIFVILPYLSALPYLGSLLVRPPYLGSTHIVVQQQLPLRCPCNGCLVACAATWCEKSALTLIELPLSDTRGRPSLQESLGAGGGSVMSESLQESLGDPYNCFIVTLVHTILCFFSHVLPIYTESHGSF